MAFICTGVNGTLTQTSSGSELQLTFDAKGNETTFTSTTNSPLGSWADPTFHVNYDLDFKVDLSFPTNLETGKVTATATATTANVSVSTANVFVSIFANSAPQQIANAINGHQEDVSSMVPTGLLNTALALEAAQGYTHMVSSLNSSGNLVLTAQKSSLTINGTTNDQIGISSGKNGAVVVTGGGQSQTFPSGFLNSITVNEGYGTKNSVNIPSLPSGVAVQVNNADLAKDNITVGSGSLASVAGTVNVNNTFSETALTVNDSSDTGASNLIVTKNSVELNGRKVLTYTTSGSWSTTSLTVDAGRKNKVTIDSSSTPVSIIGDGTAVQVGDGSLASIGGSVFVSNFGTVVIDDYNDTVSRTVDLSSVSNILGAISTVNVQGLASIQLGYVTGVTISDGSANNAFDAKSSPSKDFFSIQGHFGDSLTGPAASQVNLNLFSRINQPITTPVHIVVP